MLRFGSFDFTLEPGSVAAVNGRRLQECRLDAGTLLLEYLPRGDRYPGRGSRDDLSDFTVFPARESLVRWANTVAGRLESGARLEGARFCAIGVQLRDNSGGEIPWPFACAPGCPLWTSCPAVAGYGIDGMAFLSPAGTNFPPQGHGVGGLSVAAAVTGIGLWGGLLFYGFWSEILRVLAE